MTGWRARGVLFEPPQRTQNGQVFDQNALTGAHPTLPFGTKVKVTNTKNNRSVVVRISYRGPTQPANRNDYEGAKMGIMGIVWTVIVGLIVGILARWFYPGPVPMAWWLTALLGIGGSIVGGFVSSLIWKSPDGRFHPAGWILSILGAMVLLWAYTNFVK